MAKAKTRSGKTLFNSVDITHTERYFTGKEWTRLGPQGQKILNDCPKRKAKNKALTSRKKIKVSSESKQNGNHDYLSAQQQPLVVAVINKVMQASTYVADYENLFKRDSASACARMPHIDFHVTRNTCVVSTRSYPTYDYHVNFIHE